MISKSDDTMDATAWETNSLHGVHVRCEVRQQLRGCRLLDESVVLSRNPATSRVRKSRATRSEAYVWVTVCRYANTKMPAATSENSINKVDRTRLCCR